MASPLGKNTLVFIVRLWSEPREIPGRPLQLRGTVEYVPSGARRSVKDLEEVFEFMRLYLHTLQAPPAAKTATWLARLKIKLSRLFGPRP